jgi:hypothetical protein
VVPTRTPPARHAARLRNAAGSTLRPIPGRMAPTTSSSNSALAATSATATPQAATASSRHHLALLSASTTTAAAPQSATDHQPVKATRSVPIGGGEGRAPRAQ